MNQALDCTHVTLIARFKCFRFAATAAKFVAGGSVCDRKHDFRACFVPQGLRDKGNHVLVVEHEASVIRAADHIIEIGPAAGASGGHLVFQGTPVRGALPTRLTRCALD